MNYDGKLHLAPMAGFSDRAFRTLCRSFGADFVTTEMISAKAVWYNDKKTFELAEMGDGDVPCILQIFGNEPEIMAHAARELLKRNPFSGVDINMGCPVPKVVNNGEGSALMRDPDKITAIVSAVKDAVEVPVSVKIRAGWDANTQNAPEAALAAQRGGASRITIHGKTREMMYRPPVNLDIIRDVKCAVSVTVVGNGEITDTLSAEKMIIETGCDELMIGRASLGRPWIFDELKQGDAFVMPNVCETVFRHICLKAKYKPESIAVNELRGHLPHYLKGFYGSAAARALINTAETVSELMRITESVFGRL